MLTILLRNVNRSKLRIFLASESSKLHREKFYIKLIQDVVCLNNTSNLHLSNEEGIDYIPKIAK